MSHFTNFHLQNTMFKFCLGVGAVAINRRNIFLLVVDNIPMFELTGTGLS